MRKLYADIPGSSELKSKTVVFNTIRMNQVIFAYEVFMAAILAKYITKVYVIIDDGQMEHWDGLQYIQVNNKVANLNPYHRISGKILSLSLLILSKLAYGKKVKFIRTSKIFRHFDGYEEDASLNFDKTVESSARRFFQTAELDYDFPATKKYIELTRKNSYKSHLIGKYIVEVLNANKLITSHGIYSTWEPCFEYVKNFSSIECVVYGQQGYKVQDMLMSDEKLQVIGKASNLHAFMKSPLMVKQKEQICEYMDSRLSMSTEDSKIYFKNLKEDITFETRGKVFAAFTRVVWDGDIYETHSIFTSQIEWLVDTIKFFKDNPQNTLIIRFHPSEVTMGENIPLEKLIIQKYPEAKEIENIIFVSSSQIIDVYKLITEKVDVGLIYGGMLGLEIPYLGKPIVFCGMGRFTDNGLGIEPESKKQYFDVLQKPGKYVEKWDSDKMRERALKLGYWLLFESSFHIPTIARKYEDNQPFYQDITFSDLKVEDISPEENFQFKRTVEYLVK
ncbi:MAG: hypothetical protein KAS96_04715 [Planctomycetes bacterium]|nr:hypothetical protein [Planctomycetota bacterium]